MLGCYTMEIMVSQVGLHSLPLKTKRKHLGKD